VCACGSIPEMRAKIPVITAILIPALPVSAQLSSQDNWDAQFYPSGSPTPEPAHRCAATSFVASSSQQRRWPQSGEIGPLTNARAKRDFVSQLATQRGDNAESVPSLRRVRTQDFGARERADLPSVHAAFHGRSARRHATVAGCDKFLKIESLL
jgi:hypothetical protein